MNTFPLRIMSLFIERLKAEELWIKDSKCSSSKFSNNKLGNLSKEKAKILYKNKIFQIAKI